ncbi:MAG: hypothetical protein CME70_11410 [Halobacteriovorax sp.]|nr:hypothetical protein [Halobacteriovorax sp.]|tara:strand:- start:71992 stop:72333 length:342 start_codon:yes stop_codon:yes gene_type:complete
MKSLIAITLAVLILNGCAHSFMRGTVAMKMDKKTAHVCLGNNDVKVGDKIDFFHNLCSGANAGGKEEAGDVRSCEMKILGTGTVTKLLNAHYSEVKTDSNFKLTEGTMVQKRR